MNSQIPALLRVFSYLSILTVGGGMAAFPEMEKLTVNVHHWLEYHQLIHLYSVGQLAPGPRHDDDRLHRRLGRRHSRCDRRPDCIFWTYRSAGARNRPAVDQAGEMAMAHLNSAGSGISFCRTAAGRNLEHGQRRGHGLDHGRHCFRRASHYDVAQG